MAQNIRGSGSASGNSLNAVRGSLQEAEAGSENHRQTRASFPLSAKFLLAFLALGMLPLVVAAIFLVVGYESFTRGILATSISGNEFGEERERFLKTLGELRMQATALVFLFGAIVAAASFAMSRMFSRPLRDILRAFDQLLAGRYDIALSAGSRDEFGLIAEKIRRTANRFQEVRERELAITRAKSEFISIAAHQLRTPLSAIKWTLRMLLDEDTGPITAEQRDTLQKGYDANERMIRLVSDLLDTTRIEEGRFGYTFAEGNLEDALKKVVDEHLALARSRQIYLSLQLPQQPLPPLLLDADRIALAFANLLANALNYTLPGGRVTVGIRQVGKNAEVSVADTGVGIPKEQLHRLFTKFFRADNVIRMQTEGSGLGLFIAKNIVRRHGGDITVSSQEGNGSTFAFTIPTEASAVPEIETPFEEFIAGI